MQAQYPRDLPALCLRQGQKWSFISRRAKSAQKLKTKFDKKLKGSTKNGGMLGSLHSLCSAVGSVIQDVIKCALISLEERIILR